jgi:acyl-CoA thioester hydrolase
VTLAVVDSARVKRWETLIPIRWGDMDAMAHLNNTVYFRLIEEARIQWFNALDMVALATGDGPILAHASCDFLKPMTYPSTAKVTQTVARVGRSSIDLDCVIERLEEPGVTYAKCRAVVVWMDYRAGKSAPWPPHLAALFE